MCVLVCLCACLPLSVYMCMCACSFACLCECGFMCANSINPLFLFYQTWFGDFMRAMRTHDMPVSAVLYCAVLHYLLHCFHSFLSST